MTVDFEIYDAKSWAEISEACHAAVFKEARKPDMDRVDFAYIFGDGKRPIGYATIRETDKDSVYWQYGGAIEERRGLAAVRAFEALIKDIFSKYKRVTTLVKNDNVNYLHLLMKFGFRAIGIRNFKGEVLLEMYKEV